MDAAPRRLSPGFLLRLGLLVGTLDLLSAFADVYFTNGLGPGLVLRFIAGGMLGPARAAAGGAGVLLLGTAAHYFFALLFTFLLAALYRPLRLWRWPVLLLAFTYGLLIWLLMNRVVLPLSALPARAFRWDKALKAWLILVFMIGLPLAALLRARLRPEAQAA